MMTRIHTVGKGDVDTLKKSRVVRLTAYIDFVRGISQTFADDRVTVYAAQASIFMIITVMPFLSQLVTLQRVFAPMVNIEDLREMVNVAIPDSMVTLYESVLSDLSSISAVSLASISVFMVLWSASKGIGAVRQGIMTVYRVPRQYGFLPDVLRSLLYTLSFLVLIIAVVVVLIFGELLSNLIQTKLGISLTFIDRILAYKTPFFLAFMTLVFTILYYAVARKSNVVCHKFFRHMPGAVCAALGWLLYSFGYSLYITYFSGASLIYGGLTALCLIMLWLYFCMIILLCGAEVNKLFFAGAARSQTDRETAVVRSEPDE